MASVGVIGSGTWGTGLAVLLQSKGHQVTIWSAIESEVEDLSKKRLHPNLPGISISEEIQITGDLGEAMEEKAILVMSVPSVFVRATAAKM